jgi:hypothetical protein
MLTREPSVNEAVELISSSEECICIPRHRRTDVNEGGYRRRTSVLCALQLAVPPASFIIAMQQSRQVTLTASIEMSNDGQDSDTIQ